MSMLKKILVWMGYDVQDDSAEAIWKRYEEEQLEEEIAWAKRAKAAS